MKRILVIFSGISSLWYLKFLKNGFKHCFVIIEDGDGSLLLDSLSVGVNLCRINCDIDEVRNWYEDNDFRVLEVKNSDERESVGLMLGIFTCVEMVKHVIRLRKASVLTPYQLYRYMINKEIGK